MEILDCTLRDGGYYNNWDFSQNFINEYLNTIAALGIKYSEIGFRSLINDNFKGACAFTSDGFLNSLEIPKEINIGVMINSSELSSGIGLEEELCILFPTSSRKIIKFVRVATNFSGLENAIQACKWLKNNDYLVFLNIMQVSSLSTDKIEIVINLSHSAVDILYFADSTGTLTNESTKNLFTLVRKTWKKPLGLHAHDNLSLAHSNALQSIASGADWQDGTLLGMGRGPGNSKTEFLWIEKQFGTIDYASVAVMQDFLEKKMAPLQTQYSWGTDTLYYLAGKNQIHPSFVQTLKEDNLFSSEDEIIAIKNLSKRDSRKFELTELTSALSENEDTSVIDRFSPKDFLNNKSVILLANTNSLNKHRIAVEHFIRDNKVTVLSLNHTDLISLELVDYFVSCHPLRIAKILDKVRKARKPIILPINTIPNDIRPALSDIKTLNFEMRIEAKQFSISNDSCVVPILDSLAYALAICCAGGVERIFLAGFDGELLGYQKYKKIEDMFNIFYSLGIDIPITAITPTNFSVSTKSVYGLND